MATVMNEAERIVFIVRGFGGPIEILEYGNRSRIFQQDGRTRATNITAGAGICKQLQEISCSCAANRWKAAQQKEAGVVSL